MFRSIISIAPTLSFLSTVWAQPVTSSAFPIPTIDLGYEVHGASVNSSAFPYYNFTNIRFAAPPLGALRFATPKSPLTINRIVTNGGNANVICPQAIPAWVLTAEEFLAGASIQYLLNQSSSSTSSPSLSSIPSPVVGTTEDCLFLDVIEPASIYHSPRAQSYRAQGVNLKATPDGYKNLNVTATTGKGGAAVMVWIYGGGFTEVSKAGSGSPATLLARSMDNNQTGVIYVALNYRLGLYGWMSGPTFQENGTANAGLYYERLALEWVQQYIHLFGGDKNRVTVFGESAGGGSVLHQITAFGGLRGKVPFQHAILQSPAFVPFLSNNQQENTFNEVLQYASVIANRTISTVQDLRGLSEMHLYYVNAAVVGVSPYGTFTFNAAVDGKFVPALPGVLLLHGQFDKSLKIMIGHNANEGLLFISPFLQNNTQFVSFVESAFPDATQSVVNYITEVLYPEVGNTTLYTSQSARTNLFVSESIINCNTRYLDLAFKNQTYSYFFSVPPGLHGEDVACTFFNGDSSSSDDGRPVNTTIARAVQGHLTRFAQTGQPNEPGVPYFPAYGLNSSVQDNNVTAFRSQLTDTVANARCAWWQKALYY